MNKLLSLLIVFQFTSLAGSLSSTIETHLDSLEKRSGPDGFIKSRSIPSNPLYNLILLNTLNLMDQEGISVYPSKKLKEFEEIIWSFQNIDGGIYLNKNAPSSLDASLMLALVTKDSKRKRFLKLKKFLENKKLARSKTPFASLFLMGLELDPSSRCISRAFLKYYKNNVSKMPFVAQQVLPYFVYLNLKDKDASYSAPSFLKIKRFSPCIRLRKMSGNDQSDISDWLKSNFDNKSATFMSSFHSTMFYYLAKLSLNKEKFNKEQFVSSVRSFVLSTEKGILISPGGSSVGVVMALTEALQEKSFPSDKKKQLLNKSLNYLEKTMTSKGLFNFLDKVPNAETTDDTLNGLSILFKADLLRKEKLEYSIKWLKSSQNKNGGFPSWNNSRTMMDFLSNILINDKVLKSVANSKSISEVSARNQSYLKELRFIDDQFQDMYLKNKKYLNENFEKHNKISSFWFESSLIAESFLVLSTEDQQEKRLAKTIMDKMNIDGSFSFQGIKSRSLTGAVLSNILKSHYIRRNFNKKLTKSIKFLMKFKAQKTNPLDESLFFYSSLDGGALNFPILSQVKELDALMNYYEYFGEIK